MIFLWNNIKKNFPIFSHNEDIVYFDNASTVHKPQYVINMMNDYIENSYANIHRWTYSLAEQSEWLYKDSKKKIAELIWWDYREIIYTYNATYASNILAQSLVKTYYIWPWDTILIWIWDHHATIVPRQLLAQQYWFHIEFITLDKDTLEIDWNYLSQLIDTYHPKVVVCSHVSNVTWFIYDVQRIGLFLKSQSENIFFAVDGSQAVPHMKIDVKNLWCDAYFFTGHKMMWPTGIGVLRIEKLVVRQLQTMLWWGGIIESVTTDSCSLIRTADKFEPWTPNLIGAIGIWAACDFYNNYSIYEYIYAHENLLYTTIVEWLMWLQDKIIVLWWEIHLPNCGIVSLIVDQPLELSEHLANKNICVRAWGHCAHPLLHYVWQDKWVLRISPFIYNTLDDVWFLLDTLRQYCHW
jgi:selenocysteine lyase/cysteine desulfurase